MGKPSLNHGKAVKVKKLKADIIRITVKNMMTAKNAYPGQFVNVKCNGSKGSFLRRPFSIAAADEKKGTFDICFEIRGKGTKELSCAKEDSIIDFIGPAGQGWDIKNSNRYALVGGGIGVFPLYFLAKKLINENKKVDLFLGYRTKEKAAYFEEFKKLGCSIHLSSDDGTLGEKGFITDFFKEQIDRDDNCSVYTCGPEIMMKKTALLCEKYDIDCQVSMERRMGCGIGACLVCSCKVKAQNEDGWEYKKACVDGPVFDSKEIIWE